MSSFIPEMNVEWLHCNKCLRLKAKSPDVAFYLTICQHVFCRMCLARDCYMCGVYAKAMKIEPAMSASIKSYLEDFATLQKKMQQILNFQTMQKMHLEKRMINFIPKHIQKRRDLKRLDKGLYLIKESVKREKSDYEKVKNQLTSMIRRCDNPAILRAKSNRSRQSLPYNVQHSYRSANTSNWDSDVSFLSGYSNASRSMRSNSRLVDSFYGNETIPSHAVSGFRQDSMKGARINHDGSL